MDSSRRAVERRPGSSGALSLVRNRPPPCSVRSTDRLQRNLGHAPRASLALRVVFYWTVLTLGAILFFATVTLPWGGRLRERLRGSPPLRRRNRPAPALGLPLLPFCCWSGLLAVFYSGHSEHAGAVAGRFAGAIVVALLLTLNNFLEFSTCGGSCSRKAFTAPSAFCRS